MLGFVVNYQKSQLNPTQSIEFLGFRINSVTLNISLPLDKVKSIRKECQKVLENPAITIRELARLLGKRSASIQAVFPAPLHYRHIQAVKKRSLTLHGGYESQVCWTEEALEELKWWKDHLTAWNGRAILGTPPQLTIETDASTMGWGACCGNFQTRGLWSQSERLLHMNCLELLAGRFALKSFLRNKCNIHVKLMMNNTTAISYINKMGGPTSLVLSSLAFDLWQWCLERSIAVEAHHLPGRLNIIADFESRAHPDSSDWKLDPSIFQGINNKWGPFTIDLFASRLTTQLPRFVSWKPDPEAEAVDAFTLDWSQLKGCAFPPFVLIGRCLKQVPRQSVSQLIIVTPVWGNPTMVPTIVRNDNSQSHIAPIIPRTTETRGRVSPSCSPSTSRMASLRSRYEGTTVSLPAQTLLLAAWRTRTEKTYSSAWRKWTCWCCEQQVNPLSASLDSVVNFLASQFEAGLEYHTLNIYRSALSATHPQIQDFNVGEHPLVVQLLKGIFNSRPPVPRYTSTWDVSKVTSYLEGLGSNEQLSLKQLSRKLAFLLAITSAERGSELIAHDLRFRRFHPEGVSFNLPELTKEVRVGKPLKTSFHSSFPENELLCPCSCLKQYEMQTQVFRTDSVSEPNKLFLSVNNPHKPVSSATLSHWVKNCLLEAGIDSKVFKAHSTRGAATSAALRAGISIPEIVRLANWPLSKSFITVLFGMLVLAALF